MILLFFSNTFILFNIINLCCLKTTYETVQLSCVNKQLHYIVLPTTILTGVKYVCLFNLFTLAIKVLFGGFKLNHTIYISHPFPSINKTS